MEMIEHILPFRKRHLLRGMSVPCLVLFLLFPSGAFAQCEDVGAPNASADTVDANQFAQINAMLAALQAVYTAEMAAAQVALFIEMDALLQPQDWFWERWFHGWQDMTKQLSSSELDETRQLGSALDANNATNAALMVQMEQANAKKRYQPTDQACVFDTTARYMSQSSALRDAVSTGYSLDFSMIGNNQVGFPAQYGAASLHNVRWNVYQTLFCDMTSNNGFAGCPAATPATNAHILPSMTLFARETIDMTDPNTQAAVTELIYNITGYAAPDPIMVSALSSITGLQQRQTNREYITQMDAVGALVYSVVADRVPGRTVPGVAGEAPEIRDMRTKMGIGLADSSLTPSVRETRQAIVEQLWDPGYYKELYDSPSTITQKEVYLKAYSLVMLYDIIAKQEKISNVYAIETANMLEKIDHVRGNGMDYQPLR
ncbi:MAG: hypothetical protein V1721_05915 [Pseudomonadota bacterium]